MRAFILFAFVAMAAADVSHVVRNGEAAAEVLRQEADVFPDQYKYGYETSNGISAQESGAIVNPGREDEGIAVQGSSRYTAPDGTPVEISYTADATGYHPVGPHLPTPPPPEPIPEYIAKALAWIAAHPPQPETVRRL